MFENIHRRCAVSTRLAMERGGTARSINPALGSAACVGAPCQSQIGRPLKVITALDGAGFHGARSNETARLDQPITIFGLFAASPGPIRIVVDPALSLRAWGAAYRSPFIVPSFQGFPL